MNKKLLTVAIGAALGAAPMLAAQADVKLFGRVQAEIAQLSNDGAVNLTAPGNGGAVNAGTDQTLMNDAVQGRFGIAIDEDLGGGLTAVGMIEFVTDSTDGYAIQTSTGTIAGPVTTAAPTQSLNSRHFYVGLSHKQAGTLRFGRIDGPYKTTGAQLDPYIATNLEARNNYGMSGNSDGYGVLNGHGSYLSDMIQYISPTLAGLTLDVAIGADGTGSAAGCGLATGTTTATPALVACGQSTNTRGDLGAALTWKGGPAMVFVAYNKMQSATPSAVANPEPNAKKIGAQIKLGGGSMSHTINAQFEKTDRDVASTATWGSEGQFMFLGYHLGLGKFTVSLQGGKFEDDVVTEGTYYSVAGKYNFSKTAMAWLGYRHTELENSMLTVSTVSGSLIRDENVLSLGLRKDF